ncbi:MAG: methylthioribulose 1-phosphate dehydratase [Acidobacteriota bacterium]
MENLPARLIEIGRDFHARGWVLGTSGNFSVVVDRAPRRVAITSSGADKGALVVDEILEIDESANVIAGTGRPSDETLLHLAIVARRDAGAVLHTHSVWATLISRSKGAAGGVEISGYEMLKGLSGVRTHLHTEYLPIVENSQDMQALSATVDKLLVDSPEIHGFLISGHGLYTWGKDLIEARRHVEIFEFLLEVTGRSMQV